MPEFTLVKRAEAICFMLANNLDKVEQINENGEVYF